MAKCILCVNIQSDYFAIIIELLYFIVFALTIGERHMPLTLIPQNYIL